MFNVFNGLKLSLKPSKMHSQHNLAFLLISKHYTAEEISEFHSQIWNQIEPLGMQLVGAVVDAVGSGKGWSLGTLKGTPFLSLSGQVHRSKQVPTHSSRSADGIPKT
jgi:hypothetical protein